jgi:hypothetical protein
MVNEPTNKRLYQRVKSDAKRKFKVWPSAYASGWLVKEYKRRGGGYRRSRKRSRRRRSKSRMRFSSKHKSKHKSRRKSKRKHRRSGLSRWFAEEWIDVCQLPKIVPCGRKSRSRRSYPYCRPRRKVTSSSPRTARSLSKSEIKRRCKRKKSNPRRRIS